MEDDTGLSNVFARGMEMRRQRARMLNERKTFTPLDRSELDAIRTRHSADDIDTLLLDITFLHHWLDKVTDDYHETLDRLNDANRKLSREQ